MQSCCHPVWMTCGWHMSSASEISLKNLTLMSSAHHPHIVRMSSSRDFNPKNIQEIQERLLVEMWAEIAYRNQVRTQYTFSVFGRNSSSSSVWFSSGFTFFWITLNTFLFIRILLEYNNALHCNYIYVIFKENWF